MADFTPVVLGSSFSLGIAAQWLAWRLRLPSILLLLLAGILAGPVLNVLHPYRAFGESLMPMVSLFVAVVLFEGGLSLQIHELREVGSVVFRLITIGALVSWLTIGCAAHFIAGLNWSVALVLGAVLVVTGPTVIGPLLQLVRPTERIGNILRWEGILIDSIGAILALIVYEAAIAAGTASAGGVLVQLASSFLVGIAAGLASAGLLYVVLLRHWAPQYLQSPVALMFVMLAYIGAQVANAEAGLVAVTVMGVALANQRKADIRHIVEFKENLRVLLLAWLFVMLAARLRPDDLTAEPLRGVAFFLCLVLVVRPLAVALSTAGTSTTWKERLFLALMAPRGIVAAAVASAFGMRMAAAGIPQADRLVPLVFLVIIGTVALYGLNAVPLARALGLRRSFPQGMLILGAHAWARDVALALQRAGVQVMLVDTNPGNVGAAHLAGLNARVANVMSEAVLEEMGPDIGRFLALTANDEVNRLATLHFVDIFGRGQVYQVAADATGGRRDPHTPHHLRGRLAFGGATFKALADRFRHGEAVHAVTLTPEFDWAAFRAHHDDDIVALFLITPQRVRVFTEDSTLKPKPGDTVLYLRGESAAHPSGSRAAAAGKA